MQYVATLPAEVPMVNVDATPDMQFDDQSTPADREGSSLGSDKTFPGEEGSHVPGDKTPAVEVDPSELTKGEPEAKETEPMKDVDVKMADSVAQEGVEAVQRIVNCGADPDSPVFLNDAYMNLKKRKKEDDGRLFWLKDLARYRH